MLAQMANRPAVGSADESEGSQKPEGRALPADVSNRLGLVDFGNNEEVQALRAAGIEVINSEIERIGALNVLFDEMFSPVKRIAELKAIMGKNFIGPEHYQELFPDMELGEIPPIPEKVTAELLNANCKLCPNKRVSETHMLAYVPAESILDFIRLVKNTINTCALFQGGKKLTHERFALDKPDKGQWVLMPKFMLLGSSVLTEQKQDERLKNYPEYVVANSNPLVVALVMNRLVHNEILYEYNHYATCKEIASTGERVIVGGGVNKVLLIDSTASEVLFGCWISRNII